MATGYRTSLKATRMNAVKTDIDSGGAAGSLEIGTTAFGAILSTHTLSYPSSPVTATDTLTFSPIASATTSAGTPAVARIKTSGGTVIVDNLTVGTSGQQVIVDVSPFTAGGTASVTGLTIQHSA